MATHSGILAWNIPRTEEPGRLQSMDCKEPNTTEHTHTHTHTHIHLHVSDIIYYLYLTCFT